MTPKQYAVYQEFRGQVVKLATFDTEEEAELEVQRQYDEDDYGLASYFTKEVVSATRTKKSDQ